VKDDEQAHPFAIVPVEVVMDTRLTLEAMRVLVTLYSFRNKNTGLAFPSREALSKRCGMHPSNISNATTKLVDLGWLIKSGSGGHSKATRYNIQIPEIVAESATLHKAKSEAREEARKVAQSATVAEPTTVAQQATTKVAQSATRQLAQSATRKEHTNITNQLTDHSPDKSGTKNNHSPEDALQAACKATWKSYSTAYFSRYGVEPIRNAPVNVAIKSFCKKIPHHEAPHVAAFFVAHNDKYYVQKTHQAALMSKDAEGLRTQWATNNTMTSAKATKLERTSSNRDAVNQAIEMTRARNQNAAI